MTEDVTQGADRDFVEHLVKQLVENPDAVVVTRRVDEMGVLITLEVDPADMGKIIGKNGQTAKALRVLLRVIGSKNNARVNLKIMEPGGEEAPMPSSAPVVNDAPPVEDSPESSEEAGEAEAPAVDEAPAEEVPAADVPVEEAPAE